MGINLLCKDSNTLSFAPQNNPNVFVENEANESVKWGTNNYKLDNGIKRALCTGAHLKYPLKAKLLTNKTIGADCFKSTQKDLIALTDIIKKIDNTRTKEAYLTYLKYNFLIKV